jgi:hypothetical protein
MNIHQLNVSHNDRQDRLLLRMNTPTGEEFRFWLTRRLTLRLLPALQQAVGQMESSPAQVVLPDAASRQMLTDLQRESFMQTADFQTPYAEQAQQWPLGEEPMLVTDVALQFQPAGMQMALQDKGASGPEGQVCQLLLQAPLLHGLIHLIGQAMDKAQWQPPVPDDDTPAVQAPLAPSTGYRH